MWPAQIWTGCMYALTAFSTEPWHIFSLMALVSLGEVVTQTGAFPLLLDTVSPEDRMKAIAANSIVFDAGAITGAAGLGLIGHHFGITSAIGVSFAASMAGVIALKALVKRPTTQKAV
jgi:predicted MFS family arabinose efflux permease